MGFWLISATASYGISQESNALCQKSKSDFISDLARRENRISFRNQGGLLNAGVCWWHSRFQRNALYLTQYAPHLPPLTQIRDVKRLFRKIKRARSVVVIPGFQNLYSFSEAWSEVMISELERWQRIDGFLYQRWITGLTGKVVLTGRALEKNFKKIQTNLEEHFVIPFLKVQSRGPDAHAWLAVGAYQKAGQGYYIETVDSNYPTDPFRDYNMGQSQILQQTPYLEFRLEQKRIAKTLDSYCER